MKRNNKTKTQMPSKAKKALKIWTTVILSVFLLSALAMTCFAADEDPITVVNKIGRAHV